MRRRGKAIVAVTASLLTVALGASSASAACPNEALRTGPSANLPDCRAYELVTPRETNGQPPNFVGTGLVTRSGDHIPSPPATADGTSFLFAIKGAGLPGSGSNGYANTFRAQRGPDGWSNTRVGPSGQEAKVPSPGGFSANHEYTTFRVESFPEFGEGFGGSLALPHPEGSAAGYIRYPNGTIHLVGEGTIPSSPDIDGWPNGFADDIQAEAVWITSSGDHIILQNDTQSHSKIRLTPDAPPDGVGAVYDRTSSGLQLASLLPGDVTPGSDSTFQGASKDGSTVLFQNESNLYARINDSKTELVTTGPFESGGSSADGRKVFYLKEGNLYSFDTESQIATQITASNDAEFVNISSDGSHVYFDSPSQLDGTKGALGDPNLYVWNGSGTTFIATVATFDLAHQLSSSSGDFGLTQWSKHVGGAFFLADTSRTSQTGEIFAFESVAQLTSYDNEGHREIYRYSANDDTLTCVSCNPAGMPASGDAGFTNYLAQLRTGLGGFNMDLVNLSSDGETMFFVSDEGLVPADSNGVLDVYEWRAGNLSLISTGTDSAPTDLMGATPDGHDVFIRTGDQLVVASQEAGVPAVYDARVDGGFPSPITGPKPCIDGACQGEPGLAPARHRRLPPYLSDREISTPSTLAIAKKRNVESIRRNARRTGTPTAPPEVPSDQPAQSFRGSNPRSGDCMPVLTPRGSGRLRIRAGGCIRLRNRIGQLIGVNSAGWGAS